MSLLWFSLVAHLAGSAAPARGSAARTTAQREPLQVTSGLAGERSRPARPIISEDISKEAVASSAEDPQHGSFSLRGHHSTVLHRSLIRYASVRHSRQFQIVCGAYVSRIKRYAQLSQLSQSPLFAALVRTFSTVLKARCARRAPGRRWPADGAARRRHRPGRGAAARPHGQMPGQGSLSARRRRPPLKALRATAATAHAPDPARPPRPGPHRPPPVPTAQAGEEVASSRRPSIEPRKITVKVVRPRCAAGAPP